ncbi:MAG TPA: response regulator transcription factor [Candidatus Dormibacteraeota bacterium]|nr:response regulator transcription factor [Candidatus Dormibacteraeota bacterium]
MDLLTITRGTASSSAQRKAWVIAIMSRRPTDTAPRPRNGHGRSTTTGDAGPPIETATTAEPAGLQPVPIRVMIVDDHRVAAEALSELLARYPNIEVVGWAAAVSEALAIGDGEPADVAIIDFRLSDQRWSDAAAAIRFHWPGTSVVIVNADENDDVLIDAIEAGVAGYLIKSATGAEVVAALRRAVTGEALFPARRLADVLARQRQLAGRRKEQLELLGTLTPRELEILTVMARGLDNRAMARELGIGYSTVRSHVRGVLEKLGAHSKLEAVARAMELDLLHTHS